MNEYADIIIIGAGMAGASIGAHLAQHRKVVMLEAESEAGYHSTGRSAAAFDPSYGNPVINSLTRAARPYFAAGTSSGLAYLTQRRALWLADDESIDAYNALLQANPHIKQLDLAETQRYCPKIKTASIKAAAIEDDVHDIDVDLLHQEFLSAMRSADADIIMNALVMSIQRKNNQWRLTCKDRTYSAPIIVNAAGAWGDEVARMAGVEPVGLQPKRRTAALVEPPIGVDCRHWPLIADAAERWYCRPMGMRLMISPADETPVEPCDAAPEEIDVATGIDRFEQKIDFHVQQVPHRWAGLRCFVEDKSPVIGFDPEVAGFFWCVGQGGYGIQTAPAAGIAGASILLRRKLPDDLLAAGIDIEALSPKRLRN